MKGAHCPSIAFDTYGIPYTRACGKVIAFQYGSADAFGSDRRGGNPTIDSNYVDGVSLTYGINPLFVHLKHSWRDGVGTQLEHFALDPLLFMVASMYLLTAVLYKHAS